MELRSFQIDIPGKGTINVDFALHFSDDDIVSVQDIKLHADFDSRIERNYGRIDFELLSAGVFGGIFIAHNGEDKNIAD